MGHKTADGVLASGQKMRELRMQTLHPFGVHEPRNPGVQKGAKPLPFGVLQLLRGKKGEPHFLVGPMGRKVLLKKPCIGFQKAFVALNSACRLELRNLLYQKWAGEPKIVGMGSRVSFPLTLTLFPFGGEGRASGKKEGPRGPGAPVGEERS